MIKFKFLGKEYMFTHLGDSICRYDFGTQPNIEHWHKIALGFYRRSNHWIR